ncbi:MAG: M4 family metallopeptidase, partial [Planctomycetota bacterium]
MVHTSHTTGLATFVTSRGGGPIDVSPPNPTDGRESARAEARGSEKVRPIDFLNHYGHLFGIADPSSQLVMIKSEMGRLGQTHTTFQQVHAGIPVFSALLRIHQDSNGHVVAANGDFYRIPAWLNPEPVLSSDAAAMIAEAMVPGGQLAIERNELVIVDPRWYGDPPIGPHLAYHVVVSDPPALLREAFFIDARTGEMLDRWTMTEGARHRRILTAYNTTNPGVVWREEGEPSTNNGEVDRAYDYAGDFYDFFWRMFGRDSINDEGFSLEVTVNYSSTDPPFPPACPFAFWAGSGVKMCTHTTTDDIVAHEFGHGLMSGTAALVSQGQSGMLKDSYSDIWGELVDLFNGNAAFLDDPDGPEWPLEYPLDYVGPGTDTPNNRRTNGMCSPYMNDPSEDYPDGVRWLIAEDSTSYYGFGGPLRDMWEPSCYGQPDRALDFSQPCYMGSGVPNHAFAILTDGKVFNGHDVTGIGPIKAAAVWYHALTVYLVPTADFEDAFVALTRAAHDHVGTFPNDPRTGEPIDAEFTESDAVQVDLALRAVQMNTQGVCGASPDVLNRDPPDHCSPRMTVFSDTFEGGVGGWTVENTASPNSYDWVLTTSELPYDREGTAWFIDDPRECTQDDDSGVHSLTSPPITIPAGINELNRLKLAFAHHVATDYQADGGNLKIKVDSDPWQLIPPEAFEYNEYNTFLEPSGSNNPLAGESAWSGVGGPWGTSVVDLSQFVGPPLRTTDHLVTGSQTIQIRFEFGKDRCGGYDGWFVDDFVVYICSCDSDAFCDDGVFCNGAETCVGGLCRKGDEPCTDDYCDEHNTACIPAVFWDDFNSGNLRGWELESAANSANEDGFWTIGNPVGTNAGPPPPPRVQPEHAYSGLGCAYTGENPRGLFYEG